MGVLDMVKAYLADSKVMIKNKHHVTFDVSIRVFVYRMQTPVIPMPRHPAILMVETS